MTLRKNDVERHEDVLLNMSECLSAHTRIINFVIFIKCDTLKNIFFMSCLGNFLSFSLLLLINKFLRKIFTPKI